MTSTNSEGRPAGTEPASKTLNLDADSLTRFPGLTSEQSQVIHNWLADSYGVANERLAFVAIVEIADGKYRRRPYLTLAGAQAATERAEARGSAAKVGLFELRPLGRDS